MKAFVITIIASSLLSLGLANPVNVTERASGGVYVCPGPNWSPTNLCQDVQMTDGGCWTIPWQTLGSIGPDPGWVCSMFVEPGNCFASSGNLNSGGIWTPGVADLTTWNDGVSGKWNGYWFTQARTIQCVLG
ncbi:uncharacterized protein TrAFT101_001242 [Trichoderma asperellum]|uniref:Uncharacterized protein n=1 Tax=Trichoderma asperellum (strain ATCC 204424 / CBS 433.97 / NBRC 101777) TaxID=1042311 RepID=A0A2T3ZLY0_TRIA4|nr:hypothetical protein M441DRAFT_43799 [Trichoderma asperellum CBS 433.97]PTB45808.1 hypothetical protein M441DRAFT_43799 [Trichoderma asperellum CBS 433.97]UKZ85378.1 hypothetical protein TrAFT101_001242 [Trichoderma asperellum]